MAKVNLRLWLTLLFIVLFTQFYHPVNGLADDQIGLVTAEKVIQNITSQEGYKDLTERYIETGGLHPATALGLPWINPIYTLLTHSWSTLFGLSIPKWHLLSVLLFIGLLFFAKKLGDFFFGKKGFIFPLLLATNLYVLVAIRNSIILFSLSLMLQFATLYFFLKAHEKFTLPSFFMTGLFLFLSLSNGSTYSPVTYLYLLMILVCLFVWKKLTSKEFSLWDKKYYLLLFLLVPWLSLASYFTNDLLLNTPLGSSLEGFLYFTKSKFPPSEFPTLFDKITGSLTKFKEVFLGTSFREIFGPHQTFFPYQTPVLDKAAAFLFFLGILSFFKNFNYKKFIILAFLTYTFYFLYGVGAARIFIVFVPFLLLVSASGFVFLTEALETLKFHLWFKKLVFSILILLFVYNIYFFDDYFVVRANSNLIKGSGVAEIESYLKSIKKDKTLVFMEGGYPTWYLADFRQNDFVINSEGNPEKLREKILALTEKNGEVILIFPSHLYYIGNPGVLATDAWEDFPKSFNYFFEAFPEITAADKIIFDHQGTPQHYLFRFSKKQELPKVQRAIFNNQQDKITLDFNGEILSLRIKGGVEKLKLGEKEIAIRSSPSMDVIFNFGGSSSYNFYRNYATESFKENLINKEKLAKFKVSSQENFVWLEPNIKPDQPPYLLEYLFDFPYQVKKAEIKNEMRLFNAAGSQTAISGYLVNGEENFKDYQKKGRKFLLFEIKSDNSNTYGPGGEINVLIPGNWGVGRLSSYVIKNPESKKLLISLKFSTQYYRPDYFLAHLYTIGDSSFFKFTLDTTKVEKPRVEAGTVMAIEKKPEEKNPVVIDIIYRDSL